VAGGKQYWRGVLNSGNCIGHLWYVCDHVWVKLEQFRNNYSILERAKVMKTSGTFASVHRQDQDC
jgi:hypothetical protein